MMVLTKFILLIIFSDFPSIISAARLRTNLFRKLLCPAVVAVCALVTTDNVFAATGAKLFEGSCSGCHAYGGNILPFSSSKNLKMDALNKYGYNNVNSISDIIKNGKGAMAPYGQFISQTGNIIPAKFTDQEITSIAEYVLEKAADGWREE